MRFIHLSIRDEFPRESNGEIENEIIELFGYFAFLEELTKPEMIRPSKSNARHLLRRACFNLPKLSSISTAYSSSSVQQTSSPTSQTYPSTDSSTFSTPFTHRKTNLHEYSMLNTSQSKEAPSRGVSPRIHRNTPVNNIYNPSSIEKI